MKYKIKQFLVGSLGSLLVSGGNLMISFLLLSTQDKYEFGQFSFFLVLSAFFCSMINALISSPLSIKLNREGESQYENLTYIVFSNILAMVFSFLGYFIFYKFSNENELAIFYAVATYSVIRRWSGRIICHCNRLPIQVMISDIVYFFSLLLSSIFLVVKEDMQIFIILLSIGGITSEVVLGKKYLKWLFLSFKNMNFNKLKTDFDIYGKWSLLGVITTEVTTNFHSYFITIVYGPVLYAPIAAAQLFFRPTLVVQNSLSQMEKPLFSRLVKDKDFQKYKSKKRTLTNTFIVVFIFNIMVIVISLLEFSHVIYSKFPKEQLLIPLGIISFIIIIRLLKNVLSIIIQSQGEFKILSKIYLFASFISMFLGVILTIHISPIGSLCAILVSELFCLLWMKSELKKLEVIWIK